MTRTTASINGETDVCSPFQKPPKSMVAPLFEVEASPIRPVSYSVFLFPRCPNARAATTTPPSRENLQHSSLADARSLLFPLGCPLCCCAIGIPSFLVPRFRKRCFRRLPPPPLST